MSESKQAASDLYDALWAILRWDVDNVIPIELWQKAQKAIDVFNDMRVAPDDAKGGDDD